MVSPAELSLPSDPSADVAAPKRQPLISDDLYRKLTEQNQDAWTSLVESTSPRLTRSVSKLLPNPQDREEAIMTGLASFAGKVATPGEELTNPSSYLATCVENAARDIARSNRRREREIPASTFEQADIARGSTYREFLDRFADKSPGIEEKIVAREELEENQTVIETMSDHRQTAILMTALGYEYEEIAETTNQRVGTVKSGISRARDTLEQQSDNPAKSQKTSTPGRKPQPMEPSLVDKVKQEIHEVVVFSAA